MVLPDPHTTFLCDKPTAKAALYGYVDVVGV
jgi:hypothetical protein